MNIDKAFTDIFDFCADTYAGIVARNAPGLPDTSHFDISNLVNEENKADPTKFYELSDALPDVDMERKARLPMVDYYEGAFPSPVQTPFQENNTVYLWYYKLRRKRGGGPTVVIINGLGVDGNEYLDWYCWRFAAWGLSSILINIPYHIKRVPEGSHSGQYLITADTDWSLLSVKQSFQDTQLLVNWLKTNGAGDVGVFGVSFGALMSGLYICNAHNSDFAVMGMPPMEAVDVLGKMRFADEIRECEAGGKMSLFSDPAVPRLFNMATMMPNIPRERIFIGKGIYDRLVTPESIDAVAEKWGGLPWLCEYPTGHINTFVFNLRFIRDVRRFVKQEIV